MMTKEDRLVDLAEAREKLESAFKEVGRIQWEIYEKDFQPGLPAEEYLSFAKEVEKSWQVVDAAHVPMENVLRFVRPGMPKIEVVDPEPDDLLKGEKEPEGVLPLVKETAFRLLQALLDRGVEFESGVQASLEYDGAVRIDVDPFIAWSVKPAQLSWPFIHVRLYTGELPRIEGTTYFLADSFIEAALKEYEAIKERRGNP